MLKETTQHPTVLYPVGAAVIGGLAAIALGPSVLALGALIGGGVAAAGGWMVNRFLRKQHFASRYVDELRKNMLVDHEDATRELQTGLKKIGNETGQAQLRRIKEKFDAFKRVLDDKLTPGELTYGRYLGIAEQVYFAVLDNLSRVLGVTYGAAAIDLDYTHQRMHELKANADASKVQRQEIESLRQRIALAQQQQEKIQTWLADNEQAMTRLDHTAMALAATETRPGLAQVDLETAMAELQRMAIRADRYQRNHPTSE